MLTGALLGTLMLSGQFVLFRILERFGSDPLADSRIAYARSTILAAKAYMPFGAGFGTFVPVYATVERPEDMIGNMFANHAHNDLLEIWLESGFMGPALALAFLLWLVGMGFVGWRKTPRQISPFDVALIHAAFMAAALLSLHSLVDYPLRTSALMGVMAFCCALMIAPPVEDAVNVGATDSRRSRQPVALLLVEPVVRHSTEAPSAPQSVVEPPVPFELKERVLWGSREGWPETWTASLGGDRPAASAKPKPSAVWDKKLPEK